MSPVSPTKQKILSSEIQETREIFDKTARNYDQRARTGIYNFSSLIFQRRKEIVLKFLDKYRVSGKLLDFGMGPGVFVEEVTRRNIRFHGIDIAPEMVRLAEQMNNPLASYEVGDMSTLSAYEAEFDAFLAIGLIDYLEDTGAALRDFAQTLNPGGYLFMSFRNKPSMPNFFRDAARRATRLFWRKIHWRDNSVFSSSVKERKFNARDDLAPLLQKTGFEVLEVAYQNCSPFFINFPLPKPLWRGWLALDRRIAKPQTRYWCSGGVIVARKGGAAS